MYINRNPPAALLFAKKARPKRQRQALKRLKSFLDTNNPKLARLLVSTWKDQQAAITYAELREAILSGGLKPEEFVNWQKDYTAFFNKNLKEILLDASTEGGAQALKAALEGRDLYTPMRTGIENWLTTHGDEWITEMTAQGKEAISAMVQYTSTGMMTVDELSRVIRPTIGLTKPQAMANLRYYETVKANFKDKFLSANPKLTEAAAEAKAVKRAQELSLKYAARQQRQRALMIAQTELAFAYNKGADAAIRECINEGLLPPMKKIWCTSGDDRVCPICAALDGVVVGMDNDFDFKGESLYAGQKQTPPAHPRCACTIIYEEV